MPTRHIFSTPDLRNRGCHHRRVNRVAFLGVAVLSASVIVAATSAFAAQGPVGLGTADSFAILAGSGITNTGATTITGDVGTFPTPTETGFAAVTLTGTNHFGDAVTQQAKDDLVTAYNDAAGRTPVTSVPVELGGGPPLLAGIYASPTFGLTGTLTLDAQGDPNAVFIFQAGSTLITEANSRVLLINGADPCRVVWQVGSSATFKTGSEFVGDVLAQVSITAQTAATFRGRLLARDGAVTLDTNTITNSSCASSAGATTTTTSAPATTTAPTAPTTTTTAVTASTTPPVGATSTIPGAGGTPTTDAGAATRSAGTPSPASSTPPSGAPGTPTRGSSGPPPTGTPGSSPRTPSLPATGMPLAPLTALGVSLFAAGVALAARPANRHGQRP
jgi:hypothetical protein